MPFGPKKVSNAPSNDVAPLKIITYRAIKTTGTLVVLCTRVLLCSVVVCCCVLEGWGGLLAAVLCEEVFRGLGVVGRDPGSGAYLIPGSGMGRKSASGSGIRDEQLGSYFLELRNHFFCFFLG
jgi:hypothetical protein